MNKSMNNEIILSKSWPHLCFFTISGFCPPDSHNDYSGSGPITSHLDFCNSLLLSGPPCLFCPIIPFSTQQPWKWAFKMKMGSCHTLTQPSSGPVLHAGGISNPLGQHSRPFMALIPATSLSASLLISPPTPSIMTTQKWPPVPLTRCSTCSHFCAWCSFYLKIPAVLHSANTGRI